MTLKDEIVAGESYSLEFKRVPNEEREIVSEDGRGVCQWQGWSDSVRRGE